MSSENMFRNAVKGDEEKILYFIKKLARIAVTNGYGRIEWWCLDWNKPSIDFYLSLGAKAMNDRTVYRVAGERLLEMAER